LHKTRLSSFGVAKKSDFVFIAIGKIHVGSVSSRLFSLVIQTAQPQISQSSELALIQFNSDDLVEVDSLLAATIDQSPV
jgi:hypothetical protein